MPHLVDLPGGHALGKHPENGPRRVLGLKYDIKGL
jgi:hypothetical protein